MAENEHKDYFGTVLHVKNYVLCTTQDEKGRPIANEGTITRLLPNGKLEFKGLNGLVIVDAAACYYYPN